jgi:hypothetical protein
MLTTAKRCQRRRQSSADAGDLDLVARGADEVGGDELVRGDPAERDRRAERVAMHGRGDPADTHAVAPDRLVVEQCFFPVPQQELDEAPPHAGLALAQQRLPPDEAASLTQRDGKAEPASRSEESLSMSWPQWRYAFSNRSEFNAW